jgi:hypothetical protein
MIALSLRFCGAGIPSEKYPFVFGKVLNEEVLGFATLTVFACRPRCPKEVGGRNICLEFQVCKHREPQRAVQSVPEMGT